MQYYSNKTLSQIVFGTMSWGVWGHNLSTAAMCDLIVQSLELGVTTFDHADIYGHYTTEAAFGEALKLQPSLRDKLEIVTKCGIKLVTPNRPEHKIKSYDTSKHHILQSVDKSLQNFGTDYLDVLLIHRPSPLMHPEEIAEAFFELKTKGKVLAFGVSNFTPTQFEMVQSAFPLVTNQVEASLLHLSPFTDGTFDKCLQYKISPMIWSPLAGGKLLTDLKNPTVQQLHKVAKGLCEKYAADLDQIFLAWLLKHPAKPLPVIGTARIERLQKAVETLQIHLTDEEWFELLEAAAGHQVA